MQLPKIEGIDITGTDRLFSMSDRAKKEFADRLRWAMKQAGYDVTRLAKAMKITYEMARRYTLGRAMPQQPRGQDMADLLGVNRSWLIAGDGIPAKSGLMVTKQQPYPMAGMARQGLGRAVADADDQAITVPVFDVAASCGTGSLQPDHEPIIDFVRLSRAWVQRHLVFTAPANLAVISAHGDSMQPTFGDGDILLVDTGVAEVKLDAIYMLECVGELFIKRIQRRIGGGGHIMVSDNQSYRDQEIDMKRIKVLGRVIWAWNGKKL